MSECAVRRSCFLSFKVMHRFCNTVCARRVFAYTSDVFQSLYIHCVQKKTPTHSLFDDISMNDVWI